MEHALPAFLPNDHELIKETQEDGTVLFKHPVGDEVGTIEIDLYSFHYGWIDRLQSLVDMLDDDDYGNFGGICNILLQNAKHELEEVHSFISQSIGYVKVETVARDSFPYRAGRVVGLSVAEPKEREVAP